ncbi:MAG: Ig-like domain-containing protein [Elusimicrobia bacterium]|nr:Ig-like domain-containing protein [Elusimicrobiota bacterium]
MKRADHIRCLTPSNHIRCLTPSKCKMGRVGRLGLRALCVVALSLSWGFADQREDDRPPSPPLAPSVVALSPTALQVTVSSTSDHHQNTRYRVEVDDDGDPLFFNTIKYLLPSGVLDSQSTSQTWLRLNDDLPRVIPINGLRVNRVYRFRVQARRGDRVSSYSTPTVSVYTLAMTPLQPDVRQVGPNQLRIKVQPGDNPPPTMYAIQVVVQGTASFLNLEGGHSQPTAVSGTATEWHTRAEWGGTGGVVHINLLRGSQYSYRVKARNGDSRETGLGSPGTGTPELGSVRAVWLPEDADHRPGGWTRMQPAQFIAEGAVSYRRRFDQLRPSESPPLSPSDTQWDNGLEPVSVTFSREGVWYFHLWGYAQPNQGGEPTSSTSFPLGFDTTPPAITSVTAYGLVGQSDAVELTSGEPTTLTDVRFQWTLPVGECLAGGGQGCRSDISPIRGFTTSFDRSSNVEPQSDPTRLSTNTATRSTVPAEPATYYFKVRALDGAGNWGLPSPPFVYRVTTQQSPALPRAEITLSGRVFHRRVQRGQRQAQWIVGTPVTSTPTITFTEVMDPQSVRAPGAVTLSAIRKNDGQPVEIRLNSVVEGQGRIFTVRPQSPFDAGWTYELQISRNPRSVNGRQLPEELTLVFTTALNPQQPNRVQVVDNPTALHLQSNAIPQLGHIGISEDPFQEPLVPDQDPQPLTAATNSLLRTLGPSARVVSLREFVAFSPQGDPLSTRLQTPALVILPLPPRSPGLSLTLPATARPAGTYGMYLFDRANGQHGFWARIPAQADPPNNTLTASVTQLGIYGVFLVPDLDLSQAIAFPVPFKPSEGHQRITFANLSTDATIKIYTINGELVRELRVPSGDRILQWDVTNDRGEPLGSDVFIYVIENSEQRKIGKLMVIR